MAHACWTIETVSQMKIQWAHNSSELKNVRDRDRCKCKVEFANAISFCSFCFVDPESFSATSVQFVSLQSHIHCMHALIKLPGRRWISFQREKYVHSCSNLFHEHIQIHIWNILTRTASQNTQFSSLQTVACVYIAFGFDGNICCAMRKRRRGEKTGRIKGKSPHSVCHLGNAHSNADTILTARANQTFCTAYYYGVFFITF